MIGGIAVKNQGEASVPQPELEKALFVSGLRLMRPPIIRH
jgi:hypothetical protein